MNGTGKKATPSLTMAAGQSTKEMVQSLKEIVNYPDDEIYSALKESNMDPNEAINRLLTLDTFHEVKRKREKKKENKDGTDSRHHNSNSSSNRGGRGGTGYAGRAGSVQLNYTEPSTLPTKPTYKKENGMYAPANSSYSAASMTGVDLQWQSSVSASKENKLPTAETGVGISISSQPSEHQPAWVGAPGQVSMADVVKMGRPQNKTSNTVDSSHRARESPSISSQDFTLKDEWPLIDKPPAYSMSAVIEERFNKTTYAANESNLHYDRHNQNHKFEGDGAEVVEDSGLEKFEPDLVEVAGSVGTLQDHNSGDTSRFDNEIHNYDDMTSYQPHEEEDAFEDQEDEDDDVEASLMAANINQLSLRKDEQEKATSGEENRSLVIPSHLQVQSADCSHLSFGSFLPSASAAGNLSASVAPGSSNSEMEEASTAQEASLTGHIDTRDSEYYDEERLRSNSDVNLDQGSEPNGENFGSPSALKPEVLQQEVSETGVGSQYHFSSPVGGYNFDSNEQLNAYAQSQTSSQMQNLAQLSSVMQAYTNSFPSTLLASTVHQPARESDVSYSPFSATQTPLNYGNAATSLGGLAISVPEVLNTVNIPTSLQSSQTLPSANGHTLPQHHSVNPYSQSALPPGQYPNMISYPFLAQNYTYMPSAFQRAFSGNNSYHQSLGALPQQYKNSISVSSLPQSGAVPPGYGAFGSSTNIPTNFALNPQAAASGSTIGYDDVINSQYKDINHLLSLQQNENSAMWLQGTGARSVSSVPANAYYSIQGQSQQPAGFRQGQPSQNFGALGYPNYYNPQSGISMEHLQQIPRDGSLGSGQGQQFKQSQQLWPNNY